MTKQTSAVRLPANIAAFRTGLESIPITMAATWGGTFMSNMDEDLCLDGDDQIVRLSHLACHDFLLELPLGTPDTAVAVGQFMGRLVLLIQAMETALRRGTDVPDQTVILATRVGISCKEWEHRPPAPDNPLVHIRVVHPYDSRLCTSRGPLRIDCLVGATKFVGQMPTRNQDDADDDLNPWMRKAMFARLALTTADMIRAGGTRVGPQRTWAGLLFLEALTGKPRLSILGPTTFTQSITLDGNIVVSVETDLAPPHQVRGTVVPGRMPESMMSLDIRRFSDLQALIGRGQWLLRRHEDSLDGGMVLQ